MKDFGQLQTLLSAIFCFLGSCALLVSFLVCGHNLFKDMASRTSLLLAGFIGFWLFVLSPVSFIILFPNLFIHESLIVDPKRAFELVREIHALLERCLAPFILSAVGLGVMLGALSEIKPRKTLLQYLNKSLGLNLREFSYDFAWDTFLRGIKRHGIITLVMEEKTISGQLKTFSVISEPKQIILQDCTITMDLGTHRRKEQTAHVLVTELAQIKEIRAESNALKKHYHELNHCAQTSYYLVAGIGALILVLSLHFSSDFLLQNRFDYVTYFYDAASVLFLALSAIFLTFAIRALRHDFSSYRAAMVFYPVLAFSVAAFVVTIIFLTFYIFLSPSNIAYIIVSIAPTAAMLIIFTIYWLCLNRKIHGSLKSILQKEHTYKKIKEVVEQMYLAVDFNDPLPPNCEAVMEKMGRSDQELLVKELLEAAAKVFQTDTVLAREQANIIMKWHHILRSELPFKRRWWWPSTRPDAIHDW